MTTIVVVALMKVTTEKKKSTLTLAEVRGIT